MIRRCVNCAEICVLIAYIEAKVAVDTGHTSRGMFGSREVLHRIFMAILTQCRCVFIWNKSGTWNTLHPSSVGVMADRAIHAALIVCAELPVVCGKTCVAVAFSAEIGRVRDRHGFFGVACRDGVMT